MTARELWWKLSAWSCAVSSCESGMHVGTDCRSNLYRFGQVVIFNQAFLNADTVTFAAACVC